MSNSIAYYNERDPFDAAWLVELIKEGVIADGVVDDRDIQDVAPDELKGYSQWHLFAGIGGWSTALRLAGWPDSRPVITVSCPCQPYSSAGKGAGFADERHLWPAAFHIIHGLLDKFPVVFGEQVSSAINHGWWDLVADDLEGIGYSVEAKDFPACSVSAFHKRQRLYFVAESSRELGDGGGDAGKRWRFESSNRSGDGELAHSPDLRRIERRNSASTPLQRERAERSGEHAEAGHAGELPGGLEGLCRAGDVSMVISPSEQMGLSRLSREPRATVEPMGNTEVNGYEGQSLRADGESSQRVEETSLANGSMGESDGTGSFEGNCSTPSTGQRDSTDATSFWSSCVWLPCRDSKLRPVERATEPVSLALANGLSGDLGLVRLQNYPDREDATAYIYAPLIAKGRQRVGRLRGYGNAIVPQAAAEFIAAYIEATNIIR